MLNWFNTSPTEPVTVENASKELPETVYIQKVQVHSRIMPKVSLGVIRAISDLRDIPDSDIVGVYRLVGHKRMRYDKKLEDI